MIDLQNSIDLAKLNFKNHDFNKVSLPSIFLRDIYTNNLSVENTYNEQSDLFNIKMKTIPKHIILSKWKYDLKTGY